MKRAEKSGDLDGEPLDFERFWDDFVNWSRFKDLEVDPSICRRLLEEQGDRSFKAIFSSCLEAFRRKEGKARVGEKTPRHRVFVPRLLRWYPNARVVVIRRDPRAVVASQLKCPWVTVTPAGWCSGYLKDSRWSQILFYAENWRRAYEVEVPAYDDDSRVTVVGYEDLVQDTESTVRAVCQAVGEAYEPTMIQRRKGAKVAKHTAQSEKYRADWSDWVEKHHAKTEQTVSTASLGKWKKELTPLEVYVIEGLCARGMGAAGYAYQGSWWQLQWGRALAAHLKAGLATEESVRQLAGRIRRPTKGRPLRATS